MKTVKFLMIAAVALFTVNIANAQTAPAKTTTTVKTTTAKPATPVKAEKKVSKVVVKTDNAKKVVKKGHK